MANSVRSTLIRSILLQQLRTTLVARRYVGTIA